MCGSFKYFFIFLWVSERRKAATYPTAPATEGISRRQSRSIPDGFGGGGYQQAAGARHTQQLRVRAVLASGGCSPYPTAPGARGIRKAQDCPIPDGFSGGGYQRGTRLRHTQQLWRRGVSAGDRGVSAVGNRAPYPTAKAASGICARRVLAIPNSYGCGGYLRAAGARHTQQPWRRGVSERCKAATYPTVSAVEGIREAQGCYIPNGEGGERYQQAAGGRHTQRLRRRQKSAARGDSRDDSRGEFMKTKHVYRIQ